MYCMRCNKNLDRCLCRSDKELKEMTDIVATKWCRNCDKHYGRCKCEFPNFAVLLKGQFYPLPQDLR